MLQLIGVDFFVPERSGPDHPEMAQIGILAVERFVRRPVLQSWVRSPVSQVDGRPHQLPSKEVRKCRVGEKTAHGVQNRPAVRSSAPIR